MQNVRSDHQLAVAHRERGESAAREELILRHSRLVRAIGRRYAGRGLALDDIIQSGYVGLIQAVDRFDPGRGVPIEAYAARTIEGEIMHLFRDRGWAVRVPRSLQDLSRRVASTSETMSHRLGRTPTPAELAEALDETEDDVIEALCARRAYTAQSLQEPDGDETGGETRIALEALADEELGFDQVTDREELFWAIRHLPQRERRIILLRFHEGLTQSEIADRVGISQMHVSRLVRSSLETLREHIAEARNAA